jgi:phenol 2-monooxygenase
MNTGVHDAVNLSWKLGGVLKGWYDDSILDTYEVERKPEAQRVIDNDKTVSALITGRIPEWMGSPDANPNELLQTFLDSINRFSIGLAIHYKPNNLNQHSHVGRVPSGHRGPDLLLARPGTRTQVRLYQITKNVGKFYAIVFSGNSALTIGGLRKLRHYLDSNESFTRTFPDMVSFITIIPGDAPSADEHLGVKRFGPAFYDTNLAATRYGFSPAAGGIVILRPDGIVGFSAQLEEGPEIGTYFKRFVNIQCERKTLATKSSKKVPEAGMKEVEFDMETTRSF